MNISKLINELTIEEKCSLLVGKDAWNTQNIDRLNIPSLSMSDGPHGLRKVIEDSSISEISEKAVCYPSLVSIASSFDPEVSFKAGKAIAKEFKSQGVNFILGPGVNIKRHPFCGRNFEYFSEDPVVSSKMAEGYIKGAKSEGIGVCLKHYALNSQESYRMSSNSLADKRAKYEIYYKSFANLIKLNPEMIMCSYNKIDGKYASENIYHLKNILRDEFGFENLIISDWTAVNNRTNALFATLDLEMPGNIYSLNTLISDFKAGKIPLDILNSSVKRILKMIDKFKNQEKIKVDLDKHHLISADIAAESIVLLKNEGNLLPITEKDKILLIGDMAKNVRFQGGGSSHINSFKIDSIHDILTKHTNIEFIQGYKSGDIKKDSNFIEEAINLAPNYDKILIACGLTDEFESEGYDRTHLSIPKSQEYLINKIAKVNHNIILILELGSPIKMPFINNVKAIINCYLGGEAIGLALDKVIYGKINPSGRLAETFAITENDIPSNKFFANGNNNVFYQESIYVGYRYYQSINMKVLFPFGYGLSYSQFDYSNYHINKNSLKNIMEIVEVSIDITNNGPYDGKEVVMLFFENKSPKTPRPKRELIDFTKVILKNGETKTVTFKVKTKNLSYYHSTKEEFISDDGIYNLQICKNAQDVISEKPIKVLLQKPYIHSVWNKVESYNPLHGLKFSNNDFEKIIKTVVKDQNIVFHRPFNINNNIEDIQKTLLGKIFKKQLIKEIDKTVENQTEDYILMVKTGILQIPIRSLVLFSNGKLSMNKMKFVLELINHRYFKAIKYLFRKD